MCPKCSEDLQTQVSFEQTIKEACNNNFLEYFEVTIRLRNQLLYDENDGSNQLNVDFIHQAIPSALEAFSEMNNLLLPST
jgi:hypothetical protein